MHISLHKLKYNIQYEENYINMCVNNYEENYINMCVNNYVHDPQTKMILIAHP